MGGVFVEYMVESTRGKILKTSLRLFAEKGYFDVSTKEIADQSGVGEATLFNQFSDKSTLYKEVISCYGYEQIRLEKLEAIDQTLTFSDLENDICKLAMAYFQSTFDHLYILRIFVGKISNTPKLKYQNFCMIPQLEIHMNEYLSVVIDKNIIKMRNYSIEVDLFISHITRLVLDISVHKHLYVITDEINVHLKKEALKMSHFFCGEILSR